MRVGCAPVGAYRLEACARKSAAKAAWREAEHRHSVNCGREYCRPVRESAAVRDLRLQIARRLALAVSRPSSGSIRRLILDDVGPSESRVEAGWHLIAIRNFIALPLFSSASWYRADEMTDKRRRRVAVL